MTSLVASIECTLPAPPEGVYAAWTDPAVLARWVWAGMGADPVATVDLRVGGAYRVCTHMKDGAAWCFRGTYEALSPPTALRCTLVWEADVGYPPGIEHLEVSLIAVPEGMRMAFRHSGIPDERSVGGHTEGWAAAFDLLAAQLGAGSAGSV